MDFYNEVRKVERVKVRRSRESAFLKDMEVFLMVAFLPRSQQLLLRLPSDPCLPFLRGPRLNWPRWRVWSRS